tara:strand:+ start:186 stop:329 length:144 start_codon:yes stop_codon:yes gene_type:complete
MKTKIRVVSIPSATYDDLKKLAEKNFRSMSKQISFMVNQAKGEKNGD